MSKTTLRFTVAVSTQVRWPYYKARVIGPRAAIQPGELGVPLELSIDDTLLKRRTGTVVIDVPDIDSPTGSIAP